MKGTFECPFFRYEKYGKVHCEGGAVIDITSLPGYKQKYCTCLDGYRRCSIAREIELELENKMQINKD